MNPNIIDPLPAGGMTWGGKTQGPAINAGRLRPHILGPRILYVHLDELRDWVVKAGWHTEEDYKLLLADAEHAKDLLADADAKITEYEDRIETLEKALGWKPTGDTTNGDGADRKHDVQEGGAARGAGGAAGAEDSGKQDVGGKKRSVRAAGKKAG